MLCLVDRTLFSAKYLWSPLLFLKATTEWLYPVGKTCLGNKCFFSTEYPSHWICYIQLQQYSICYTVNIFQNHSHYELCHSLRQNATKQTPHSAGTWWNRIAKFHHTKRRSTNLNLSAIKNSGRWFWESSFQMDAAVFSLCHLAVSCHHFEEETLSSHRKMQFFLAGELQSRNSFGTLI